MITTCALLDWHSRNNRYSPLKKCTHRRHVPLHQRTCTNGLDQPIQIQKGKLELFHSNAFSYPYMPRNSEYSTIHPTSSFHLHISTMDASQYWPFAHEDSIWNTIVTALQFWTADFEPHILHNAID